MNAQQRRKAVRALAHDWPLGTMARGLGGLWEVKNWSAPNHLILRMFVPDANYLILRMSIPDVKSSVVERRCVRSVRKA